MSRCCAIVAALVLTVVLAACGGDESTSVEEATSGSVSDDFAGQANAICVEGAEQIVKIEPRVRLYRRDGGHDQEGDRCPRRSCRRLGGSRKLEPPADQADDFDAYLAGRRAVIDLTEPQLEALRSGNQEQIKATGAEVQAAADKSQELAGAIGLEGCDSELASEDAEAAEEVLREHLTTADPATSCSTDGLVTEAYLEGALGGVKACEKLQQRSLDKPETLPTDIKVTKITGTEGAAAFIEFEDVGGKFDGEPATATLFFDGGWKIFSVNAIG